MFYLKFITLIKLHREIAFIAYYTKSNKYSFNALVGALEVTSFYQSIDFFFPNNERELINTIVKNKDKYKIIIIAISFFTTQVWEIKSLIKTLREKFNDEILLIAGGPHATGMPKFTLKLGFDVVFIGEGEETIIEFIDCILNNNDFRKIKGIGYLNEQDEFIFTGRRKPIDLDKYPPFPVKNSKFGAIEITRGCPYVCYFCQTPYILGAKPRHRSIDVICRYIKIMKERNLTDIRFITPNAFSYGSADGKTLNLSQLEELLIKIKKILNYKGRIFIGSFPSEVRPEHVTIETISLIKKYAANDNIIIGAQSGSNRVLKLCHRGHTVDDVKRAVDITIQAGLKANVDFIFGLPGENEDDILLTIELMKELANKGARIHAHSFIPLPQTPFAYENVKKISELIKNTAEKLTAKGKIFGDWRKQEMLAIKISKLLKKEKLN